MRVLQGYVIVSDHLQRMIADDAVMAELKWSTLHWDEATEEQRERLRNWHPCDPDDAA